MSLTSLSNVKAFKGITDSSQDVELTRIMTAVDAFVEGYCGRTFASGSVTEYFSTSWGDQVLLLKQPPVTAIASIYDDPLRVYGSATLIPSTYYVLVDGDIGKVVLDGRVFSEGLNNVKITYTGGYSTIPKDLEQAAIELVWLARMKGDQALLGFSSKAIAEGSVNILRNDWPAGVDQILDLYKVLDR